MALVDGLVALASIDIEAVGLADFGRPEGWLERQPGRWAKQLHSYDELPSYQGPPLPNVEAVTGWLEQNRPTEFRPGLIHGDYQFTNVLFRPDEPELAAIVDWELATTGDPMLDLGHMLATWPGEDDDCGAVLIEAAGIPTRDELVDTYLTGTGRGAADVRWYRVLACYRLGIILEGTHARAQGGTAPMEIGERLRGIAERLFEQAGQLITRY